MMKVDEYTQDLFDSMPDNNASLIFSAKKISDEYKRMRLMCKRLYKDKQTSAEALMMIQKALVIFMKEYIDE